MNKDFTIIFEKMDEQVSDSLEQHGDLTELSEDSRLELDELAELRRMVIEITEPEPLSFTTT
jgi:hypothetical protein